MTECVINKITNNNENMYAPKSIHGTWDMGHISLLGFAKTVFLRCPPPLPKPREPPHTSNGLSIAAFLFNSKKKTYQWSQLGMIDPKRQSKYGAN